MIRLSNNHLLKYVVASGAMAFDGKGWPWDWLLIKSGLIDLSLFTIVLKTITRQPRKGNLDLKNPATWFRCFRYIPYGTVNAIGLTNKGLDWWHETVAPHIDYDNLKIVGSMYGEREAVAQITERFNEWPLAAIEYNYSCPNTGDKLGNVKEAVKTAEEIKKRTGLPLLFKVSADQECVALAKALAGLVEAFDFNSVSWSNLFPNRKSPLARLGGGGVSGYIAQETNWRAAEAVQNLGVMPVIYSSIMAYTDARYALHKLKAPAISFGSVHCYDPTRPTRIVRRLEREGY